MQNPDLPSLGASLNLLQTADKNFSFASSGKLPILDLFNTATQLTDANLPNLAIQLYRTWLAHNDSPIAYAIYFNLGVTLANSKDDNSAETAYRMAISLNSQFIEAYLNLGALLERTERPDEALSVWRKAINFSDLTTQKGCNLYVQILNNLSSLLEDRNELPEAETMLAQSLRQDPTQQDVMARWLLLRKKQASLQSNAPEIQPLLNSPVITGQQRPKPIFFVFIATEALPTDSTALFPDLP